MVDIRHLNLNLIIIYFDLDISDFIVAATTNFMIHFSLYFIGFDTIISFISLRNCF
jgi:hypothetical protein